MQIEPELSFRGFEPTQAVYDDLDYHIRRLERFFQPIISCRVMAEIPNPGPNPNHQLYHVRVNVTIPGKELVTTRDGAISRQHEDLHTAIRDAFIAIEKQLKRKHSRFAEHQAKQKRPQRGSVAKVFWDRGYGFLTAEDGHEVYFHQNSVLEGVFSDLHRGDQVHFSEEDGFDGPQASTVQRLKRSEMDQAKRA